MNEIKMYLLRKNMTIKEFAKRLGYHYTYIVDICAGRRKCGKRLAKSIELETNGEIKAEYLEAGYW